MMSRRRSSARRIFAAFALVALSVLLSGCVYLRLLQLKRQLNDFDRHFTLDTTTGVRLNCLEPVLFADDVRWLGFEPAVVSPLPDGEHWHIRWTKVPPPDARETGNFEIAFDLTFSGEKLSALSIPDDYFSVLPKEVFVSGIKSLGGAAVNKKARSVESQVQLALGEHTHPWPTQASIAEVLGQPTEEIAGKERVTWRYHFISADPKREGEDIELRLVFDATTEKLVQTLGRLPVGRINLNFAEAQLAAPQQR